MKITYCVYTIDTYSSHKTQDVEAILIPLRPVNVSQVNFFLFLVVYSSKFVPICTKPVSNYTFLKSFPKKDCVIYLVFCLGRSI